MDEVKIVDESGLRIVNRENSVVSVTVFSWPSDIQSQKAWCLDRIMAVHAGTLTLREKNYDDDVVQQWIDDSERLREFINRND